MLVALARHAAHQARAVAVAQAREHAAVTPGRGRGGHRGHGCVAAAGGAAAAVRRRSAGDAAAQRVGRRVAALGAARADAAGPVAPVESHRPRASDDDADPWSAVIHDAELFTVGPDEVVVTFRTDDDARGRDPRSATARVVTNGPYHSAAGGRARTRDDVPGRRSTAREPSPLLPAEVTTLAQPPGGCSRRSRPSTTCTSARPSAGCSARPRSSGRCSRSEPGADPYPEVMNGGAIDAIERLDPDAVLVKGDLTDRGTEEEYAAFLRAYSRLGARMRHVRGNHDAMITETIAATGPFTVELAGRDARGARHRPPRNRSRPHLRASSSSGSTTLAGARDAAGARVRSPSSVGSGVRRAQRDVLRREPRRQRSAVRGHRRAARRSPGTSPGTRTARGRVASRRRATFRSSRSRA